MDMSKTISPKSDQLNSDDLISGPITIRVSKVSLLSSPDQPVAIHFDGDNGKPYKPGKSMRRVMVIVWGSDGNLYHGRSMTLYRDEKVRFGGQAVGGIRISHMSHIDQAVTMALTETKASRKPFTVKPLAAEPDLQADADAAASAGMAAYQAFFKACDADQRKALMPSHEARKAIAAQVDAKASPAIDNSAALAAIEAAATLPDLMAMWHGLPQSVTDDEAVYAAYDAKRDALSSHQTGE